MKDNSHKEDEKEIAACKSQPPHGDRQLLRQPDSNSNGESCNSKQQIVLEKDFDFDEGTELVLVLKKKRKILAKELFFLYLRPKFS